MECQRFRAHIRKNKFVDPVDSRTVLNSLGGEYELSAELINFTSLAKQARQDYIINVFCDNNSSLFRLIPITKEEETAQKDEINITRPEIITKKEAFLEQMGEDVQKKYSGIKSRKRDKLIIILEEVRSLFGSDNDSNNDCDDSAEE